MKIVREVMDGLRVYFDFTLSSLLLYNMEREQHEKIMKEVIEKKQNENSSLSVEKSETKTDNMLDEAKEKSETKPSINSESTLQKSTNECTGMT